MSFAQSPQTRLPWHQSLEDWCAQRFGLVQQPIPDSMAQWAPYEAHRPERHYGVPTVLVVQTSASGHLQRGFVSSVELLRSSTSGFKPVLVSDIYRPPAAEWPVEQVVSEHLWLRHQTGNWLDYAADVVEGAQQFFGAQFVIAPRSHQEAQVALRHLAGIYNVMDPVLDQAEKILACHIGSPPQTPGFRGGWQELQSDQQFQRRISLGRGIDVTAEISTGRRRGLLLGDKGALDPKMQDAATQAGWSVAALSLEADRDGVREALLTGAARALRETMVPQGPTITASGMHSVLPDAEGQVAVEAPGSVVIKLPELGAIRFQEDNAVAVFGRLAQVLSHKTSSGTGDQSTPRLA